MAYQDNRDLVTGDVLIIGSGIAGALLAYELATQGIDVILACKSGLLDSNTAHAQGGLAAVTEANPLDNPELHLQDTLSSGAGLTDESVARRIIDGGQGLVDRLAELGVQFDRNQNTGTLDACLEGGHSRARVLHSKDASGRAIATSLVEAVRQHANIRVMEKTFALDLIVDDGTCTGAHFLTGANSILQVRAPFTVLATGGLGQVFSRTTNPNVATGDGIAMAYRAGARLVDMEFVQFHPTALVLEGAPAALISEAVRGAGAHLLDAGGERFAFRFHKDGELATRDIVARSIYSTMIAQGSSNVWLDLKPIGATAIEEKFPNIVQRCRQFGLDPVTTPIPVAPAAHYFMGGIWVDENAGTSLSGLFAIGECASTGLHGANRLASNSLLEGGVMALHLTRHISNAHFARKFGGTGSANRLIWLHPPLPVLKQVSGFRKAMFENAGLERTQQRLQSLLDIFPQSIEYRIPTDRFNAESANIALLGSLIARSALERNESRGAHWRVDYPRTDDVVFRKRLSMSRYGGMHWLDLPSTVLAPANVRHAQAANY